MEMNLVIKQNLPAPKSVIARFKQNKEKQTQADRKHSDWLSWAGWHTHITATGTISRYWICWSQFAFFSPHCNEWQSCRWRMKSRCRTMTWLTYRAKGTASQSFPKPNGQDTPPPGVPNPLSASHHADVQTHETETKGHRLSRASIGPDNHLGRVCGGRAAQVLHLSQDLK